MPIHVEDYLMTLGCLVICQVLLPSMYHLAPVSLEVGEPEFLGFFNGDIGMVYEVSAEFLLVLSVLLPYFFLLSPGVLCLSSEVKYFMVPSPMVIKMLFQGGLDEILLS